MRQKLLVVTGTGTVPPARYRGTLVGMIKRIIGRNFFLNTVKIILKKYLIMCFIQNAQKSTHRTPPEVPRDRRPTKPSQVGPQASKMHLI